MIIKCAKICKWDLNVSLCEVKRECKRKRKNANGRRKHHVVNQRYNYFKINQLFEKASFINQILFSQVAALLADAGDAVDAVTCVVLLVGNKIERSFSALFF